MCCGPVIWSRVLVREFKEQSWLTDSTLRSKVCVGQPIKEQGLRWTSVPPKKKKIWSSVPYLYGCNWVVFSKCAWFKCTIARWYIWLTLCYLKMCNPWKWSVQGVSLDYRYRMHCDLSHKRVVNADFWCVEGADETPPSYLRTDHGWCKQADWSTEIVQRWVRSAQPMLRQLLSGMYYQILFLVAFVT